MQLLAISRACVAMLGSRAKLNYFCRTVAKKHLLLLLFFALVSQLFGQYSTAEGNLVPPKKRKPPYQDTVMVIGGKKVLDKRYRKWKFEFSADARQALVEGTRARIGGLRIGMEHRRVYRFGVGIYNFGDGIQTNTLSSVQDSVDLAQLRLEYISLYFERVLLFNKYLEWSATVHRGFGSINGSYRVIDTSTGIPVRNETFNQAVRPLELSTTFYLHPTYFMSIGAGVGYRFVNNAPAEVSDIYNAPIVLFRFRFRVVKMIAGLFNEDIRTTY
jgi:hypothetical protein